MMNASSSELSGEHRTEPIPPEPHRFVTDVDASLEQQVYELTK